MSIVKPRPWYPINPTLVDPAWRWAWRGLVYAEVAWQGAGNPRDVRGRRLATKQVTAPSWRATPYGYALDADGGGTSGGWWRVSDHVDLQLPASWTIAVWCATDIAKASMLAEGAAILSKGASGETAGSNHNFLLSYDRNLFTDDQAGDGWCCLFERSDSAGANVSVKEVVDPVVGRFELLMGVLDVPAGQFRLYRNGILRRTRSTTFVAETNAQDMAIARFTNNTDGTNYGRWDGPILGVWLWKGVPFSSAQAALFARDPFGPFRPARRAAVLLRRPAAAAGVSVAALSRSSWVTGVIGA